MTIYDQSLRRGSIRELHHNEQMQAKIKQGEINTALAATSQTLTASLTPAAVSGNSSAVEEFALSGAVLGDFIAPVSWPVQTNGTFVANAFINAANKVTIVFVNTDGVSRTPDSGEYTFRVIR